MLRVLAPITVSLVLAGCANFRTDLAEFAAHHAPREIAVAYLDLTTGDGAQVNADVLMHAASTMKVPVMIELYRRADAGQLDLDSSIPVRNSFRSIVDGSAYSLTDDDDSDAGLYEQIGTKMPVRILMRRMIARSSNLATNLLIELVGAKRVQSTIEGLGTRHMRVLRGVEDSLAYRQGLSNSATAADLMVLMAAIANGTAASRSACAEMIEILTAQEFKDLIPAGLPPGTRVAHKTGWITGIRHDAAIVDPGGTAPYILVVLTRGFDDPKEAAGVIAEIARRVHRSRE